MRSTLLGLSLTLLALPALADQEFSATLKAQAVLPAATFVPAPEDAPEDLKTSGKYAGPTPLRIDQVGSVPGKSQGRDTGLSFPFQGQPVQGFSGIKVMPDGTFFVISDNGFGAKANSPDAMLMANQLKVDWESGKVERIGGIFFHDPDKKIPFRIAEEGTIKRYLTGADLDVESVQVIGDKIWIGDEFGPYLVRLDRTGKVEKLFETQVDGKAVRSPDHYAVTTPGAPDGKVVFNARRSKGFEGMAASPDGAFLYALLEGPLWDASTGAYESEGGAQVLRIVEFDVAKEAWSGRSWKYPLEVNGNAIGDFNMVDATTGLVIERDDNEGTSDRACPAGQKGPDCFAAPAKFKRVYKIELSDANAGGLVRKIGHIDLMAIKDPTGLARQGRGEGVFTFPFFTIENVDVVDASHIVVGNDNNLPFSAGRAPNKADDNELILLEVGEFLKAK